LATGDHPPELKEQELKQLANVTFDSLGKHISVKQVQADHLVTSKREMEPNTAFKLNSTAVTLQRQKTVHNSDLE